MTVQSHFRLGAAKRSDFYAANFTFPSVRLGSKSVSNLPARGQRPPRSRPISLITNASSAASFSSSELATYRLPHHSTVANQSAAPWFKAAVTEVVKHLESSPFLQLVRFANAADPLAAFKDPTFSSFSVPESVVKTPELWSSIAQAVTADTADVVILVQRVDPHGTGAIDITPEQPVDDSLKAHVEEACQKLVASGIGESILQGKVGECCENQASTHNSTSSSTSSSTSTSTHHAGIVPFSSSSHRSTSQSAMTPAVRGASVKVKALNTSGIASPAPLSGYWGVIVQSKQNSGAEGCYLLRAVRQVCPPTGDDHGCSCTHYSLTKVCKGEHMERQFIDSWLV